MRLFFPKCSFIDGREVLFHLPYNSPTRWLSHDPRIWRRFKKMVDRYQRKCLMGVIRYSYYYFEIDKILKKPKSNSRGTNVFIAHAKSTNEKLMQGLSRFDSYLILYKFTPWLTLRPERKVFPVAGLCDVKKCFCFLFKSLVRTITNKEFYCRMLMSKYFKYLK